MLILQDSGPRGTILCSVRAGKDSTTGEPRKYVTLQGVGYKYEPRLGPDLDLPEMSNREIAGWRCTTQSPFRRKGQTNPAGVVEPEFLVEVKFFEPEPKK